MRARIAGLAAVAMLLAGCEGAVGPETEAVGQVEAPPPAVIRMVEVARTPEEAVARLEAALAAERFDVLETAYAKPYGALFVAWNTGRELREAENRLALAIEARFGDVPGLQDAASVEPPGIRKVKSMEIEETKTVDPYVLLKVRTTHEVEEGQTATSLVEWMWALEQDGEWRLLPTDHEELTQWFQASLTERQALAVRLTKLADAIAMGRYAQLADVAVAVEQAVLGKPADAIAEQPGGVLR